MVEFDSRSRFEVVLSNAKLTIFNQPEKIMLEVELRVSVAPSEFVEPQYQTFVCKGPICECIFEGRQNKPNKGCATPNRPNSRPLRIVHNNVHCKEKKARVVVQLVLTIPLS
jgi:hypothetical protein